ncbi:NUDIX hydrolase [Candidatus Dojkabacteria bacterium]|nr:NUDIX hydrolase [Candidatus Dojkabacteria bacterium]
MNKWKVLETEDVSPHKRWFPVFRDKVKLDNGQVIDDFYYSRLGEIAIMLPVLKTGEIVFIRQYRHATKQIMLELPAGMVDGGRSVEEVAVAELEEEIGIRVSQDQLIPLGKTTPIPHKVDMTVFGFALKNVEFNSKQNLESNEDIEIVKIMPEKAFEMVENGGVFQSDTIAFLTIAREKGLFSPR